MLILFCRKVSARQKVCLVQLLNSNIFGILHEALVAHVQAVLPDETIVVGASVASARALAVLYGPGVPYIFETHLDAKLEGHQLPSNSLKFKQ